MTLEEKKNNPILVRLGESRFISHHFDVMQNIIAICLPIKQLQIFALLIW